MERAHNFFTLFQFSFQTSERNRRQRTQFGVAHINCEITYIYKANFKNIEKCNFYALLSFITHTQRFLRLSFLPPDIFQNTPVNLKVKHSGLVDKKKNIFSLNVYRYSPTPAERHKFPDLQRSDDSQLQCFRDDVGL